MVKNCVLFAKRTEFLNIIWTDFGFISVNAQANGRGEVSVRFVTETTEIILIKFGDEFCI